MFIRVVTYTFGFFTADRGGLHYPTTEFLSRLWTIYLFDSATIPALDKCRYLKNGYVEFILPYLRECSTFQCELSTRPSRHTLFLKTILSKYLSPLQVNKANRTKRNTKNVSLPTFSKKRRVGTLKSKTNT